MAEDAEVATPSQGISSSLKVGREFIDSCVWHSTRITVHIYSYEERGCCNTTVEKNFQGEQRSSAGFSSSEGIQKTINDVSVGPHLKNDVQYLLEKQVVQDVHLAN